MKRLPRRAPTSLAPVVCALALAVAAGGEARAIPAGEARTVSFKLQSEGMRLYKEGKYKEAIEAFRQVVNLNLNSFMAFYYYGICLNADRRYGEAIEPLKIALELQPDYIQAHMALGDAYLKQGDAAEARAEYLRALELNPNFAAAYDGLGRLFETTGQDELAEPQYRKALEINVAFADAYTHLGDLYLRQQRRDDAIDLFLKAIAVKPDFSSAYERLGVAYAGRRLYDDAIAAIRRSQSLAPHDPEPHVALARIYLDLHSQARAEAEIQAALAQDHDHAQAHLLLADLKRAREDFAGAVEVLQGLHERGIDDALMRRAVADALLQARDDAARHAPLAAAAEAAPADAAALLPLARFLAGQRAHQRAADLFGRAADAASDPIERSRARFAAGIELLAARRHTDAAARFSEVAAAPEAGPLVPAALFNLGVAQAAAGLDERAIAVFRSCLERAPDDARAHLYLGNAYFRTGRRAEARAAYTAFVERSGSSPEAEHVRRLLRTIGAAPEPPRPAAAGAKP